MYFGAHVKASGGVWTAIERGEALDVQAIQFFAGSPRTWKPQIVQGRDAAKFREAREASSIRFAVIHTIYLINLATVNEDFYEKSVVALVGAVAAAEQLGVEAIVTQSARIRERASRPASSGCARPCGAPSSRSATPGSACCSRTPPARAAPWA